jgi:hypothetical protein
LRRLVIEQPCREMTMSQSGETSCVSEWVERLLRVEHVGRRRFVAVDFHWSIRSDRWKQMGWWQVDDPAARYWCGPVVCITIVSTCPDTHHRRTTDRRLLSDTED